MFWRYVYFGIFCIFCIIYFIWRYVCFDPIKVYMKRVKLAKIRIRTDQNEHSS